jgi:hypothetical protein
MMPLKKSLAIALAILGLLIWLGYAYYYVLDFPLFLTEGKDGVWRQILIIVYGYTTLVIGVFLGSVYRRLKRIGDEERVDIRAVIKSAITSTDFWLGMFASPVVYIILLQAISLDTFSLPAFIAITLVGLQNGFVCNIVADTLIGEKSKTVAGPKTKPRRARG